jgi:FkbM family methyltransferase
VIDLTRAYGLTFLVPAGDTGVGYCLRTFGEFARPEVDLLDAYVRLAGDSVGALLDVGANIGAVSLPVASRNRALRVVAIEAHRGLACVLAANALNNQLHGVEVHPAAAGAAPGLVDFPATRLGERGNLGTLRVGRPGPSEQVRVVTLDQVAPVNTRIVKLDVEGYEREVLLGASRLLRETRPVWLAEANHQDMPAARELAGVFLAAGYRLFLFFAPFVTPSAPKVSGDTRDWTKGDYNFLALPSGVPNLWDLPELATDLVPWPISAAAFAAAFPYLRRYGFQT